MRTITAQELNRQMQDNGVLVVNTLDTENYRRAHIPGSHSVPLERKDFVTKVEQLAGDRKREVVVHCSNRECDTSEKAAEKLEKAGFEDVRRLRDGIAGWTLAGFPAEAGVPVGV